MQSLTPALYDARGNRYIVASPEQIPGCGHDVKAAAIAHRDWVPDAITALCHQAGESAAFSDGLIVGPFESVPPFNVLIVNTDGSLAERSGNGLTIFAQALRDTGIVDVHDCFDVNVHHATPGLVSPTSATLTIADEGGVRGVWVAMGRPEFGPAAVAANAAIAVAGTPRRDTSHIAELAAIDPRWCDSVLVRIGNPHCVTWLASDADLPSFDDLGGDRLLAPLKEIAFAQPATPFANGINLQWAARLSNDHLAARIFERGEGPTRSSGSSATAVACAARQLGLVTADAVAIEMPGGVARVRFSATSDGAFTADYSGVTQRVAW